MFTDDKRVVSLRGKSKKEDRSAIIARAAREREDRARQRERLRAAVLIQAAYRALLDLRRLRTGLHARFDAEIASLDALTFAPRALSLVRDLLLFHKHSEPSDAGRRRALLQLLLESSASTASASTNACACMFLADAARWRHQMLRLAALCLPHLLQQNTGAAVADAAATATLELHATGYLLDAAGWQWAALLPPEQCAALPAVASILGVSLGARGLYVHVMLGLRRLLFPASAEAGGAPVSPLVRPLLALGVRGLHAACSSGAPAAILDFARGCLLDGVVWPKVPPSLLSLLVREELRPMLVALAPLAPRLTQLLLTPARTSSVAALAAVAAATTTAATTTAATTAASAAAGALAGCSPSATLGVAHACANLVLLVHTCASTAEGVDLGDALSSYVSLIAASQGAVAYVLARLRPRAGASSAGSAGSGGGGGTAAGGATELEPMDVDAVGEGGGGGGDEAAFTAEEAAAAESLSTRLSLLGSPEHMAALWRALLATPSPRSAATIISATQLAAAFCELLYGSGGNATGAAVEPHPRAAAALERVALQPGAVAELWELTAAAQPEWHHAAGGALLCLFCACCSHLLIAIDDHEFFVRERPFPIATLRPMIGALKAAALATYWPPPHAAAAARAAGVAGLPTPALAPTLLKLLSQLYDRDARKSFMGGPSAWFADAARQQTIESLAHRMDPATLAATQAALQLRQQQHAGGDHDADDVGGGADGGASGGEGGLPLTELPEARRVASVLLRMPYTIPFDSRLRVLRRWLTDDREEREGMMMMGQLPFMITVRREHLLRDAHVALRGLGPQLRSPLRVRFLDSFGAEEAGLGVGVAKEFLVDVLKAGFDPAFGLFASTPDGLIYPNPAAKLRVEDATSLYETLGAILAKALYEGILVELPLARFFVARLLGRTNSIAEMPTFDRSLFESLMFLKRFEGSAADFEALTLTFAIEQYTDETLPATARRQVPLKPHGAAISVNKTNCTEYVADCI